MNGAPAITVGAVTGIVLSLGTDSLLRAAGIFSPLGEPMSSGLFLLATAYRTIYGIAGGYVTARLSSSRPMRYALILGVLGALVSLAGVVVAWNAGPEFGPRWYPIALVITAIPAAVTGAKLHRVPS